MTGFILVAISMIKGIIFFGADGGCRDAIFLTEECHKAREGIEQIILSDSPVANMADYAHLGGFNLVKNKKFNGYRFVYQCGNVQNHRKRNIFYDFAKLNGLEPLTNVSPEAYIHKSSKIGKGSQIYPGVRIMRDVEIGENVIILPNTVINHDCQIGDFCIINSSCVLNGNVELGGLTFLGAGSSIKEDCKVGSRVKVGMGSLILDNLIEEALYFGRPAKKMPNNWG